MLSCHATLSLSRQPADENAIVLVAAGEWSRLGVEGGYRRVDGRTAAARLQGLDRQRVLAARRFVAAARLGRVALDRTPDHEVLEVLRHALVDGRVVAIQKGQASRDSPADAELRRLVAAVGKATHGKLAYRGRQYRLVIGDDLAKVPGRNHYEVVPQVEARAVLDGIADASPAAAEPLGQASAKLSHDFRPPFSHPDGLLLLRRLPVQAATPRDDGPAITPSQMRAMLDQAPGELVDWALWVEVDPDDPKAADDTVVLLDVGNEEVERVALAGCPRQGGGVIATFKGVEKHTRYTLVRDYGPDEGGGTDTLFIGRSPADLEEEAEESS